MLAFYVHIEMVMLTLKRRISMLSRTVMRKVEDIADFASKQSATSYEEYIRLFSIYLDDEFKKYRPINEVTQFAKKYGYIPKAERR